MFAEDPGCKRFLADEQALKMVENTTVAKDVDFKKYHVVFFPGNISYLLAFRFSEERKQLSGLP